MAFFKENHRGKVPFASFLIKGPCYPETSFSMFEVMFINWKVTLPLSILYAISLEGSPMNSPYLESEESLYCTFLRADYLQKLFEVVLLGRSVLFQPILFIYLLMSVIYLKGLRTCHLKI